MHREKFPKLKIHKKKKKKFRVENLTKKIPKAWKFQKLREILPEKILDPKIHPKVENNWNNS